MTWNPADFMTWNPADFMKSGGFHDVKSGGFHEIRRISWREIRRISCGFHEILGHSPHLAFIKLKSFCWNTCFYNFFTGEIHQISGWNLVDFMKSLVIAPTLHSSNWRVFAETLAFIILGGFHRWYLGEIRRISRISWNPPDFRVKSVWNPYEIRRISWTWAFGWWSSIGLSIERPNIKEKSVIKLPNVWIDISVKICIANVSNIGLTIPGNWSFEIRRISPRYHLWNPPKIIKASVSAKTLQFDECRVGDFTLEIQWISPWNLVDFTQVSPVKSTQNYKSKCFSKNSSVWWMQGGGYDQGFHPWNLADFTQISPMKSTQNYKSKCFSKNSSVWWMQGRGYDQGFHEIHQISPWNLADLTCEIQWISPRYHLWNPPKIIKASVSAKTLQFDECRVGDFTLEIQWISPWNLVDFTCEIWQISPRFDLWNPPKIIKASVLAKTLQFDECRVEDFTLEIWWISPWNLVDFNHKIWQISPRFHL